MRKVFFFPIWVFMWLTIWALPKHHPFKVDKPNLKKFSKSPDELYEILSLTTWINTILLIVLVLLILFKANNPS